MIRYIEKPNKSILKTQIQNNATDFNREEKIVNGLS